MKNECHGHYGNSHIHLMHYPLDRAPLLNFMDGTRLNVLKVKDGLSQNHFKDLYWDFYATTQMKNF